MEIYVPKQINASEIKFIYIKDDYYPTIAVTCYNIKLSLYYQLSL